MKFHTAYLTFNTKRRQEIIDITDEVEECLAPFRVLQVDDIGAAGKSERRAQC